MARPRRIPTDRSVRSAFSLAELVIALVVLTIATPAMLTALRDSQVRQIDPVLASRARWLAVSKLEDVIADRHSATRGWDHLVGANYRDEAPVAGYDDFERRVTLNETGPDLATAGDGYMSVTVEVSWFDVGGTARSLSVSTVVTEYGP